ncbi:MAG: hypothetical protein SFU84_05635 [Gemmatimonadales bacterium]|nr:hypothetical protein [Gemmatimonadales bacterium]
MLLPARPTRLVAALILTTWLAACDPDPLTMPPPVDDAGYRSLAVQDEAALGVTASGIMADIGCRSLRGTPDSATIAVRLVPPRVKAYQCRGVPTARIRAAARAVRQMVLANPRWASVQSEAGDGGGGSGYYAYDHMECIWHPAAPPEYGERINADGDFEVYVLVEAQPGHCSWMAIFRYVAPGGGSVGAGEIGSGPIGSLPGGDLPVEYAPPLLEPFCTTFDRSRCPGIPMPAESLPTIRAAIGRIRQTGECGLIRAGLHAMDDSRFYFVPVLPAAPGYVRHGQISYAVPGTAAEVAALPLTSIIVVSSSGLSGVQRKLETVLAHEFIHVLFYPEYGMRPTREQELAITRRAAACT